MSLIRAETERCDIAANLQVNVDPGEDLVFFFPCENQLCRLPHKRATLHPGTCIKLV